MDVSLRHSGIYWHDAIEIEINSYLECAIRDIIVQFDDSEVAKTI